MTTLIQFSYLGAAFLFIYGLKRMSSPKTARLVYFDPGYFFSNLTSKLSW